MTRGIPVTVGLVLVSSLVGAAELPRHDFNSGDRIDESVWNLCQASDRNAFEPADGTDRAYQILVDPMIGNASCDAPDALDAAPGGIEPNEPPPARSLLAWAVDADDADCPAEPAVGVFAAEDTQRNEIRLQSRYSHRIRVGHWYGFRFRMGGEFRRCGGDRWVIGQWKAKHSGKSPWLAQRFENGVFHITVESDGCRCVVAKASGDPDRGAPGFVETAMLSERGPIGQCEWSDDSITPRECTPDITVERPPGDALPNPGDAWVEMAYYVRAGPRRGGPFGNPGLIEIFADGRPVARISGLIGHLDEMRQRMKFKIGNYRKRQPDTAWILIDDVRVAEAAPGRPPW